MVSTNWLISLYDDNCEKIANTIKFLGYNVECVGRNDSLEGKEWWRAFPFDACVVFMGSLQFARDIGTSREKHNWCPGPICDLPFFKYSNYSKFIKEELLNWPYSIITSACLRDMKEHLYDSYSNDDCIFIRPDTGFKSFTGQVVYYEDFDRDLDNMIDRFGQQNNELIIVSQPQYIMDEFRLVIVEENVVGGSTYRVGGKLENFDLFDTANPHARQAIEYGNKIAKKIPHPVYVMDVATTSWKSTKDNEVGFKVVELNSFSCSGMYACDMKKVIPAVSKWAEKQWEELHNV